MCVVSMVGDHYKKTLPDQFPSWFPANPLAPYPNGPAMPVTTMPPSVSREEFLSLKKEMEQIKILLEKAKAIDIATGQPDCEIDEKVVLLKELAKLVGVDLKEVFGK